jgi:hypothetical protein
LLRASCVLAYSLTLKMYAIFSSKHRLILQRTPTLWESHILRELHETPAVSGFLGADLATVVITSKTWTRRGGGGIWLPAGHADLSTMSMTLQIFSRDVYFTVSWMFATPIYICSSLNGDSGHRKSVSVAQYVYSVPDDWLASSATPNVFPQSLTFNPLNPSGYYYVPLLSTLHSAHRVYLCFIWCSKQRLFFKTVLRGWSL